MTVGHATGTQLDDVRTLFREYVAALGVPLRSFDAEIADLPGRYAAPAGALFLARGEDDGALGCVGVRPGPIEGACELKRLYVRPAARGTGTGRALLAAALGFARAAGYAEMLLDTMPQMAAAQALYRAHGFTPTAPYGDAPTPGLLFFRRRLA